MKQWLTLCLIPMCLILCLACRQQEPMANSSSTLRISAEGDPSTLDPRRVRDLATVTVLHMLYEGLMRQEGDQLVPALAEEVLISPDQKTYTFKLRKSHWSNGQPVSAQDFEQTWKSLLHP